MGRFSRGLGLFLGLGAAAGGVEGYRRAGAEIEQAASSIMYTPKEAHLAPRDPNIPAVLLVDRETGEKAPLGPKGERPSEYFTTEQDKAIADYFLANKDKALGRKYESSVTARSVAIRLKDKKAPTTVAFLRPSLEGKIVITDALGKQVKVLGSASEITVSLLDALDKPTWKGAGEPEPEAKEAPQAPEALAPAPEQPVANVAAPEQPLPRLPHLDEMTKREEEKPE